jgi:hypothetical protein
MANPHSRLSRFDNGCQQGRIDMQSVIQASAREDFTLELQFDTGETRIFDVRPYLEKGAFSRLKDPALFRQAYVAFDTVCWPGNLDISPETLFDRSHPVA